MKKMTCDQIDGLCSAEYSGNTPGEILSQRQMHLQEAGALSPDHQAVLDSLEFMDEHEKNRWMEEFMEKWEETPEKSDG
jgi:hypothetical protein